MACILLASFNILPSELIIRRNRREICQRLSVWKEKVHVLRSGEYVQWRYDRLICKKLKSGPINQDYKKGVSRTLQVP